MKDAYAFARLSGINPNLIITPTDAAHPTDVINAAGILYAELNYACQSKAFHDAKGTLLSHLEQHAQSPNSEIANHARQALKKLAIMLG